MPRQLKNDVWTGFGVGIGVPGILVSVVWWLMHQFSFLAKADLLLIACIAVNALLLKYFFRVNQENTGKGVLSATFIWGLLFFIYKISQT